MKADFEEYGVGEDVLAELQGKWERKVIESRVANFEPAPEPAQSNPHSNHPPYPPHPMHAHTHAHMHGSHYPPPHYAQPPPPHVHPQQVAQPQPPPGPQIKSEPVEPSRYVLNQPISPYSMAPQLSGPQITPRQPYVHPQSMVGRPQSAMPAPPPSTARYPPQQHAQTQARIPQVDGPSSTSDDSPSPPPSYAPRSSHPSLPQPAQSSTATKVDDEEAINSDLDDSDSDNDPDTNEGAAADTDIVFCTYDKVARVKNKWKCILKDGMIHIGGKDYLFAKCTGEFEW
ncbi:hypothetical protein WOLCODRAFT_140178 [Wolfiporia cocos MD-104 SS10]|uniref:Transcription factor IIA, alpha/beta subunit n=1 Tax=Wolfiporia cocos (strain MD-104) TaxID=742152 RepID=A0A2H3JBA0_WOLCO|nr:hypothetical protein WOLCODRAFT_140178 [Wolfiporia cocos MD-104 SS10]